MAAPENHLSAEDLTANNASSVPEIGRMMQKQITASIDNNQLNKNFLGSSYEEDELQQFSQKEIVCISRIGEESSCKEEENHYLCGQQGGSHHIQR